VAFHEAFSELRSRINMSWLIKCQNKVICVQFVTE
jgi:hypothetical protein